LLHRIKQAKISATKRNDPATLLQRWEDIEAVEPYFPPPREAFDIMTCLSYDLETLSDLTGTFYPYAVGYLCGDQEQVTKRLAMSVDELFTLLDCVVDEWLEIAHQSDVRWRRKQCDLLKGEGAKACREAYKKLLTDEQKQSKPWERKTADQLREMYRAELERQQAGPGLFVYAYNGARFDNVAVVHELLAKRGEAPRNYLKSNGKVISFSFKNLHFRDLCLLLHCSLAAAGVAYGVEDEKLEGLVPHAYLQNLPLEEAIERLHGRTKWDELEPYIDWLCGEKPDDVQNRQLGQSYEDWLNQFPMRQAWNQTPRGAPFDGPTDYQGKVKKTFRFRDLVLEYLPADVLVLHQLVSKVGNYYADKYNADIRVNMTVGSMATRIWKGRLGIDVREKVDDGLGNLVPNRMRGMPMHVAKLVDQQLYERIRTASRAGFCGPLGPFEYKGGLEDWELLCATKDRLPATIGHFIYKVDVTSLHPASSGCQFFLEDRPEHFEQHAGKPLYYGGKKYFRGFPNPEIGRGWLSYDFEGVQPVLRNSGRGVQRRTES
jgi:hypothetical protein